MLQALDDNIIVKIIYEKQRGNLIIPDSANIYKKYNGKVFGLVESVGPRYPYDIKPGQIVSFRRHEGKVIKFEGEIYLKLREEWVDAKLYEEEK